MQLQKSIAAPSPGLGKLIPLVTALGIVYGDIGTSPLYAIRECFGRAHSIAPSFDNVMGVLSLVVWSLIIVVSAKYLQFVMRADNKGEGGVLALTALAALTTRNSIRVTKPALLAIGLFGAALLVGDAMITPAISVMSAIEGLTVATPIFEPFVVPITIAILIALFLFQKRGTAVIGSYFGPIMLIWFICIALLGAVSISQSPSVLISVSPHFAVSFMIRHQSTAFLVLGAVFLVVTGGEALYADMGHLGRKSISQGWYYVALPALLLNYLGQGALILREPEAITAPFYHLAPHWALYPLVVLAAAATVIASQAMISGLFSLAHQCIQLGYSPRLDVIHTSAEEKGQIYVPQMNWIALIGTVWLALEFQSSSNLASAYGIAVSITMIITTILVSVVAVQRWKWPRWRVMLVVAIPLMVELSFVGANFIKLHEGGWVSLAIAVFVYMLMTTWHEGREILMKKLRLQSYPFERLLEDIRLHPPVRVSGCAVYMVGDVETTPPALIHNLKHNKVIHETVLFLTIITKEVPQVPASERLEIFKMADGFLRVIGHYGFSQTPNVLSLLRACNNEFDYFKCEEATFFLGREIIISKKDGSMSFWRKKIFTFLAKNARSANIYFRLPIDRIIEVGRQVEL